MNSNIKAVQKRQYLFSDDRREGENNQTFYQVVVMEEQYINVCFFYLYSLIFT